MYGAPNTYCNVTAAAPVNMDDTTSSNGFKILVSYYSELTNSIVIEHLKSLDFPSCTSKNLFLP